VILAPVVEKIEETYNSVFHQVSFCFIFPHLSYQFSSSAVAIRHYGTSRPIQVVNLQDLKSFVRKDKGLSPSVTVIWFGAGIRAVTL
jgi:hypothetical protein